jgi:hypothetical protein
MEEPEKEKQYCLQCGKRCYSYRDACIALKSAKRGIRYGENKKVSKNIPKRKYLCPYCGTYHLTHLPYYKVRREKKEYE